MQIQGSFPFVEGVPSIKLSVIAKYAKLFFFVVASEPIIWHRILALSTEAKVSLALKQPVFKVKYMPNYNQCINADLFLRGSRSKINRLCKRYAQNTETM